MSIRERIYSRLGWIQRSQRVAVVPTYWRQLEATPLLGDRTKRVQCSEVTRHHRDAASVKGVLGSYLASVVFDILDEGSSGLI
jgi:hypothetical protein